MAKLYGEIAAKALLTLDKSFARANGQPLDASEVYYSLAAAKEYAATAQAYIGQKIVVIENGVVSHYSVEDTAGNLKELGAKPVADGTTVSIGTDGKITLANITDVEKTGTYNAVLVNGALTWVKPSSTTVEGLSDLITALTGRVDTAEADIDALEAAVGVASKPETTEGAGDAVAATGLHKAIEDEVARATAAEKALGERIDAIDYVDETELSTALADYVTGESFNTFKGENTQAIADAKSGAEATAAGALALARTEISKEIDDDVKVAKDRADEAYTLADGKVDAGTYATDKKALEDEDAAIREIAEAAKSSIDTFLTSNDIDETVNTLKEIQTELDKMADATEMVDALALKADKTTVEGIEGRVKAIEDAPYVTQDQLDGVDGKFADYTDTEALTELLAGKQDTIPAETYDAYGAAATAKSEAISDAEGKIATAKQEAIDAAATAAAGIYATQTALGNLETAIDERLDVLEAHDHSTYATKEELTAHGTAADGKYATKDELKATDDVAKDAQNRVDIVEGKIDEITSVGGEPNVLEKVKVNGVTLEIEKDADGKSTKSVNIPVPTKFSDITDDSGFDARITAAQSQADKGVNDAAAAATAAAAAQVDVDAVEVTVGEHSTKISGLETTVGGHTTKIVALENADTQHQAEYNALAEIVGGHTSTIATLAKQTDLDGAVARIAANKTAIATINDTTIPGINGEIAKKANSADVYTKTQIGTITEGKTVVDMINDAKTAATYDDTQVKADIKANYDAIAILNGDAQKVGSIDYKVAQEVAKILNDNDDSDIDTLNEIAAWITSDTTGAAKMNADIAANKVAIDTLKGSAETEGSVLAMIAANAPKIATVDVAGLVKASAAENGVSVAEDGTMSVNSVNVNKLVQTDGETLTLYGGTANV